MEKVIKIGKTPVKLSNNVAWTMEYRDQFGRDVVQEHVPIFATLGEMVASIVGESGKTNDIHVSDIIGSVEGRLFDIMLPVMQTEFMTLVINVTWAMAKAADEDIDPPKQWVKQFETFPLDVVAPAVYDLAFKGFVSSKNLRKLASLKNQIKTNQQTKPQASTTLSSQDSNED